MGNKRLLRLPDVRQRVGLSTSEIYRRMAGGTFPASVPIGNRICAWYEREIDAWIDACVAARDAQVQEAA